MFKEQKLTDVTQSQIAAGQSNAVRTSGKYTALQARITALRNRFQAGAIDLMQLLVGASYNIGAH